MKIEAVAYPRFARFATAVLVAISRASPLALLVLLVFGDAHLGNRLRLIRTFAGVCLAPAAAAWLLRRAFAVTAAIEHGALVLQRRSERIDIPCGSIERVMPWVVPLPAAGVSLRLKSGRRFRYALEFAEPAALIGALVDAGAPPHVRTTSQAPAVIHAEAKRRARSRWDGPPLKYVLFGLVPTVPIFRLNQWIAYGGTFGEYYTYGLRAYLLAFTIYWASYAVSLVLYGALLRLVTETVAFAATYLAPSRAASVRRVVEIAHRVLYYGGVPAAMIWLLLLR